jgi:type II secretory ATPase GspE/PulE/Tfp pilus assembly ATPase PilB-like protein
MAATEPRVRRPIGQMLADQGLVTADQVRIALLDQVKSHRPMGRLMVELGFVPEAALRDLLATTLGLQPVDLAQVIVDPDALRILPCELARRYRVFPLSYDRAARELTVALADTRDLAALDQLRAHLGADIRIEMRIAGDTEIECAIERSYGHDYSIDGILREIETGTPDHPRAAASEEPSQPVIRLISALLAEAVEQGASDVHLEPEQHLLRIRYRIDGVLRPVRSLHPSFWPAMAVRLKVMAKMNIAESRAPQDGRISATLAGRLVDFRVASLPTTHGENFVLRVLDRQKGVVPLEQLGLDGAQLQLLKRMMARPEGIILVTGPTGSGKTTTLYSILGHINAEGINIMTLEDPVEYAMPSVRQTSVGEASKIDFAGGVRALLRQDPDVILVGEIRDEETAQMAIRAAMTGHQVYSTLHTPSAAAAIPRLLDMGIAPDIMTGNVIGIVAQRLVRRLCQSCRQPHDLADAERRLLGVGPAQSGSGYRATGCDRCDYQGYRGRVAIMEILRVNEGLDELIARRATARELTAAARDAGFRTLADDGARLVCGGVTSLEELSRVVDLTERMP